MFGTTGGPARGMSNHFIPWNDSLFPGKWKTKVIFSDLGVFAMLSILYLWARLEGSWTPVLCFYFLPYIVANGWLVLYTWLQHTDVDIPHYEASEWTWVQGAFTTVDRPYGAIINFLHHGIGSTHVAHHLFSYMPHYNAWEATRALQKAFPEFYMYDPTPIIPTMWRVARKCVAVVREEDTKRWVYISTRNQIR
jgi:fatty acid desaturase